MRILVGILIFIVLCIGAAALSAFLFNPPLSYIVSGILGMGIGLLVSHFMIDNM